jgi:hypothetical protein
MPTLLLLLLLLPRTARKDALQHIRPSGRDHAADRSALAQR